MNFFIIQERGRHEKNREFREALCMKRSLERLGHKCTVWGLGYENYSIPFEEASIGHDIVLSLENYDTGWHPIISGFSGLKAFWSIDSHCVLYDHVNFCQKNKIDLLLNSTERYIPAFQNCVRYAAWFPNGYPEDLISPRNDVKRIVDIGFCGSSIDKRNEVISQIERTILIKKDIFLIGEDMVRALSSYKIAFNYNIADDINFRTFEATGAGALLLTNYTPNLEKLFKIGEEVVVYQNIDDLIQKILYFVKNNEERNTIASAGILRSKADHSYDARSRYLIDLLSSIGIK